MRAAVFVVGVVVVGAFVLWANWMVQRYYILGDDTARGEKFRAALLSSETPPNRESYLFAQCKIAAEAFYGHGILDGKPGWAPPSEKAFFHACTGLSVGGVGGGD
jgi:hypothetical protein